MKPIRIPKVTALWTHEAAHEGRARLGYQEQLRVGTSCHPMPESHHLFRRRLSLEVLSGYADTVIPGSLDVMYSNAALGVVSTLVPLLSQKHDTNQFDRSCNCHVTKEPLALAISDASHGI